MPYSDFTTAGTYSWTCPDGVTSVGAICIGGGAGGSRGYGSSYNTTGYGSVCGGGGGGLGWKRNIPVTPGTTYTVVVGNGGSAGTSDTVLGTAGGDSYFIADTTVCGRGGKPALTTTPWLGGLGGGYVGDGGGSGGNGGNFTINTPFGTGGGGAGGYSGNGGNGGNVSSIANDYMGSAGQGGGSGGGTAGTYVGAPNGVTTGSVGGAGGGGTGYVGEGLSGIGGAGYDFAGYIKGGRAGSGGTDGDPGMNQPYSSNAGGGGFPGGGGGGAALNSASSTDEYAAPGARGAVRLIYNTPNDLTNQECVFTTPGLHTWESPSNVTSVNVVAIGGGAGGGKGGVPYNGYNSGGGGGGGLAWINNYPVTGGKFYRLQVGNGGAGQSGSVIGNPGISPGAPGEDSFFISNTYVCGQGGKGATGGYTGGLGGGYVGDGGGAGGNGGDCNGRGAGGGGGAGGYSGNGGNGGATSSSGADGAAGGGGGGAGNGRYTMDTETGGAGGGGGTGLYGQGSNGVGAITNVVTIGSTFNQPGGAGGSGGTNGGTGMNQGNGGSGGNYGGGGGGVDMLSGGTSGGSGTSGAVRITWRPGYKFPYDIPAGITTKNAIIRTGISVTGNSLINKITSLPPTYSLAATPTSTNEGVEVVQVLNTTNVQGLTLVPFTMTFTSNINTDASYIIIDDIVMSIPQNTNVFTGNFTVNKLTTNSSTLRMFIIGDGITEGSETITIDVPLTEQPPKVITINDSSTALATDIIIDATANPVNEGFEVTFYAKSDKWIPDVITTYTLSGTGITTSDFSSIENSNVGAVTPLSLSGSIKVLPADATIAQPYGFVRIYVRSDATTEGTESLTLTLGNGASKTINISDTSQAISYTFDLSTPQQVGSGTIVNLGITTTGVASGTVLYWSIIHGTTAAADFNGTGGSFTITNAKGTIPVNIVNNVAGEGSETFQVAIQTVSGGTNVAASPTYTIISEANIYVQVGVTEQTWTVPLGVTSVSVVAIGGGGGGGGGYTEWYRYVNTSGTFSYAVDHYEAGGGGGGGALAWSSNIPVTPGTTATVSVGLGGTAGTNGRNDPRLTPSIIYPTAGSYGTDSYFIYNGVTYVRARGGAGGPAASYNGSGGGAGGTSSYVSASGGTSGGGSGGGGGSGQSSYNAAFGNVKGKAIGGGAGGGAGGYSGGGGNGGSGLDLSSTYPYPMNTWDAIYTNSGQTGAGGGAEGGFGGTTGNGGGGGGTQVKGQGTSGSSTKSSTNASYQGKQGSLLTGTDTPSVSPYARSAGGGGGGSANYASTVGAGGGGALRIIWGTGRSFPNNAA